MKVTAVDFLRSAASAADLPRDPLRQIALVGRSNVGKSSLINALVKRKAARTSAAPGKTRLINLYVIALAPGAPLDRFYLVDLPGYGYARGGAPSQEAFEALTRDYFACPPAGRTPRTPAAMDPRDDDRRPEDRHEGGHQERGDRPGLARPAAARGQPLGPTAVLHLVDIRHPGLPQDLAASAWLAAQGRPYAVVATKSDKLARAERSRAVQTWNDSLNTPVLPVSAATGEGMEDLWTLIVRLLTSRP